MILNYDQVQINVASIETDKINNLIDKVKSLQTDPNSKSLQKL